MAVPAELVAIVRARTGAGVMECKRALTQTNGHVQKAVDYLKKRGLVQDDLLMEVALADTSPSPRVAAREITKDLPLEDARGLRTGSAQAARAGAFVPNEVFDPSHPTALAIYCSDGRFTNAVEELTAGHLGNRRLDTLTIAGGPALLTHGAAHPAETEVVRRSASFLIKGHHIKQVVMISHEGCGFYRDRTPQPHAEDRMKAQQLEELQMAARWIRVHHSGLEIRLYYAEHRGERITFEPIAID